MMQYVAFLRGINVGGRTIQMADLKACFEAIGLQNVVTYLQSGNVTFETTTSDPASLKQYIEERLSATFHYPAIVQVYTLDSLPGIIQGYPFDASEPDFQHYVVFIENNLAKDLAVEVEALDPHTEAISVLGPVLYWKVQKGMTIKSPFSKYLVKPKYRSCVTTRNLKTLQKIVVQASNSATA